MRYVMHKKNFIIKILSAISGYINVCSKHSCETFLKARKTQIKIS